MASCGCRVTLALSCVALRRDLAAEMRGQSLAALKAQCLRCKLPQTGDKEALVERLNGQKQMVFEATVGAKLRV
eukprot:COSAG05_NODE_709_length_7823_cov_2.423485_6_plen_74_part_00